MFLLVMIFVFNMKGKNMKKIFYALSLSYMIFSADAANAEGKLGTADNPIVIDDDDTVQSVQLVQSVQPVRQSNGVWTSVKAWVKKPLVIVCSFVGSKSFDAKCIVALIALRFWSSPKFFIILRGTLS